MDQQYRKCSINSKHSRCEKTSKIQNQNHRWRPRQGFTLTELVIVIMVMGTLSAYITTKFANLDTKARKSTMEAVYMAVKKTSLAIHQAAKRMGVTTDPLITIKLANQEIDLAHGYAVASEKGIFSAIDHALIGEGKDVTMTIKDNRVTFQHRTAKVGKTCQVVYDYDKALGGIPDIAIDVSNCD